MFGRMPGAQERGKIGPASRKENGVVHQRYGGLEEAKGE